MMAQADVANEADMRRVVAEADARFGRIDGVIHSAGIAGGGMIQLKQRDVAAAVLAPKVEGTRVLARLFHDRPLDFLLLCSSLTAVLGGVGQVDYCGANASLDAFARQYAADTGTFAVSVNWNAWREGGMAVDTAVPADLKDVLKGQMLQSGISNEGGIDAFRRILGCRTEHQVAIFPYDVQATLDFARGSDSDADAESMVLVQGAAEKAAPAASKHQRPPLQTAYVAARTEAEQKICAVWQDLLGIEQVGVQDNFFDLGGHSLLAVRVMARVNEELGTELPVARLYEGLTAAFLASVAAAEAQPALSAAASLDEDAQRRDKARRMKEQQQQRRRVSLRR
jgi:NAD(P)-dependent dehydrogenase (short-subunit alcohol dehydrogenase family)/acyl carrier protein